MMQRYNSTKVFLLLLTIFVTGIVWTSTQAKNQYDFALKLRSTTTLATPCGTNARDSCIDIGYLAEEANHDIDGWEVNEIGGPVVPTSGDISKRFQTLRDDNSFTLIISDINIAYTLVTEVEDGGCDDSFQVFVNSQGPIYEYTAKANVAGSVVHSIPIEDDLITSTDVMITYRNMASDQCGLAAVFNARLVNAEILNDESNIGLVAYYSFDHETGNDSSTSRNHGQSFGTPTYITGVSGKAANFGGYVERDYFKVPNSSSLQFTDAATVSLWGRLDSNYGHDIYCSAGNVLEGPHALFAKSGNIYGFLGHIRGKEDNTIRPTITMGQQGLTVSEAAGTAFDSQIRIDEWFHAVFVMDNTGTSIYLNGQLVSHDDRLPYFDEANARDLYLGIMDGEGTCLSEWYPFDGALDEIKIYNRVLSPAQISTEYSQNADSAEVLNTGVIQGVVSYYDGTPILEYIPDLEPFYNPLEGARFVFSYEGTLQGESSRTSGANGYYGVSGLQSGSWRMDIRSPEAEPSRFYARSIEFDIEAGDTINRNAVLIPNSCTIVTGCGPGKAAGIVIADNLYEITEKLEFGSSIPRFDIIANVGQSYESLCKAAAAKANGNPEEQAYHLSRLALSQTNLNKTPYFAAIEFTENVFSCVTNAVTEPIIELCGNATNWGCIEDNYQEIAIRANEDWEEMWILRFLNGIADSIVPQSRSILQTNNSDSELLIRVYVDNELIDQTNKLFHLEIGQSHLLSYLDGTENVRIEISGEISDAQFAVIHGDTAHPTYTGVTTSLIDIEMQSATTTVMIDTDNDAVVDTIVAPTEITIPEGSSVSSQLFLPLIE